jgi:hypothetical protein
MMKSATKTHMRRGCFFGGAFSVGFKDLDIKLLRVVPVVVDLRG